MAFGLPYSDDAKGSKTTTYGRWVGSKDTALSQNAPKRGGEGQLAHGRLGKFDWNRRSVGCGSGTHFHNRRLLKPKEVPIPPTWGGRPARNRPPRRFAQWSRLPNRSAGASLRPVHRRLTIDTGWVPRPTRPSRDCARYNTESVPSRPQSEPRDHSSPSARMDFRFSSTTHSRAKP
jgi:hypothetical protein